MILIPLSRAGRRTVVTSLVLVMVLSFLGCSGKSSSSAPVVVKSEPKEEPAGPPLFEDVTKMSGVDFTYRNGEDEEVLAIIESLGGGVGLIDFNRDGLQDLFVPGGGYYEGKKVLGYPCKLYQNVGDFKFKDVTQEVGLDTVSWCYSHGVSVADYDCDGFPDLVVSGYARLVLLHNEKGENGQRKFIDVTQKAKLIDDLWSASTGWADLDGDGFPELYVCHYGDWGFDTNHPKDCFYHGTTRDVCQPRRFKPLPHRLFKNNADGTFSDISTILQPKEGGHGLGVLLVDVNDDRKPDIYVANDTDDNYLYINRSTKGQIKLEETGLLAGVARDDRGNKNGSMGVDATSYDRSGKPSIIVTNYENELPALYHNRCTSEQTSFTFGTNVSSLGVIGGNYVSWGTGFLDIENRGWEDLMIVSGHAIRYPLAKFGRLQNSVLMKNVDGKLKVNTPQGGSYFQDRHNSRGIAIGDLNNDGKVDVIISRLNAPLVILKNISQNSNHWIALDLKGENNRDLVGTKLSMTVDGQTQYRFVKGGGSFASANSSMITFGLGTATKIDTLKIDWNSGLSKTYTNLEIDRLHSILEAK